MHPFRAKHFLSTLLVLWTATTLSSFCQTFGSRPLFKGLNGAQPNGPLVQGFNGNFYGTTKSGGPSFTKNNYGHGTVFELTRSGKLTTLYNFCSLVVNKKCTDGQRPQTGLILATDGNFYGTTYAGGTKGGGTIFRITPNGKLTTVYSFCSSSCLEGEVPNGVIQGTDGNLYGTTATGGAGGYGTAFSITPSGKVTVLHSFDYVDDGFPGPYQLLQARDGNFYGVSPDGVGTGCIGGCGSVFRVSPKGDFKTLYKFCALANCADGYAPEGALTQGSDGNLYGSNVIDDVNGGGTIFKLTLEGQLTTLYSFCSVGDCLDGDFPGSGVVQGTDGNLYGTTEGGGSYGGGEIFKLTPDGTFILLHSFCAQAKCPDGDQPTELLQATNGNFYGVTNFGGDVIDCPIQGLRGCGDAFLAEARLAPFVQPNPAYGKAGWKVDILGDNLAGTTSVTFNGSSAAYTVLSSTHIKATVPAGATSGPIEVSVPGGILTSNVAFQVLP